MDFFKKSARSQFTLKWLFCIVSIVGTIFSLIIIFFVSGHPPILGYSSYTFVHRSFPRQANFATPVLLTIPNINLNAALESVGLTSRGELDVPKGPTNAAWFNLGPRPGENGTSVIDGHFGWWKNGAQAVFNNLNKLRKGDKIYVEDKNGNTTTFAVRGSRKYDPNSDASGVFVSNDGQAHLNLITCDGVWDSDQKSYPDRLVVFADKETE